MGERKGEAVMSGGAWNYQQFKLEEKAELIGGENSELGRIILLVSKAEHICDWAESCDTSREIAEPQLYDLIVAFFNKEYGYDY
jgi:hypothetical protein